MKNYIFTLCVPNSLIPPQVTEFKEQHLQNCHYCHLPKESTLTKYSLYITTIIIVHRIGGDHNLPIFVSLFLFLFLYLLVGYACSSDTTAGGTFWGIASTLVLPLRLIFPYFHLLKACSSIKFLYLPITIFQHLIHII